MLGEEYAAVLIECEQLRQEIALLRLKVGKLPPMPTRDDDRRIEAALLESAEHAHG